MHRIYLAFTILLSLFCPKASAHYRYEASGGIQLQAVPVSRLSYYADPTRPGWEERGAEFNRWLAPSVRIGNGGTWGSGTIVYYDPITQYAYVLSCGHLFNKSRMPFGPGREQFATVEVFYHNEKKLDKPEKHKAEVLAYENFAESVYDVSLLRFKATWEIGWYLPIAALDTVPSGDLHSLGCDGAREVAHYMVRYVKESKRTNVTEFVTAGNSPRGGRSGGGLFVGEQLVGICSRGNKSNGYWSSLNQIYRFLGESEFKFLLSARDPIRLLPVIERISDKPAGEIPLPY